MPRPEISYAVPVSCLEVSGTITETHDTVLDVRSATPVTTVALHTHGVERNQVLQILTGGLRDTSLSLKLTDDGLLTSADAESAGQLGRVVVGVIGAGAAIAGAVAGLPPIGALAAGVATERFEAAYTYLPPAEEETPEQKVAAAYAQRYPEIAALRTQYAARVQAAMERIATLAEEVVTGGEDSRTAATEIREVQHVLSVLRAELGPLDAHFALWRAGTITTHVTQRRRCFSLDVLRGAGVRVTQNGVALAPAADEAVRFAWETLGVAVTMEPVGTPQDVSTGVRSNAVIVRLPRRIRLSVYENVDGRPVLRNEQPYLVVDSACDTQVVHFRRSLWAKRSTKLGFGDLGVMTSYAIGSTSSAAAMADAAGQVPQTISSNLEEAKKIDDQVAALAKTDGAAASHAPVDG